MKRRSIIALFLIVAMLTIGVGYANLTDTLTIASEASIKTFDEYVHFLSATTNDASRATAEILADDDTAKVIVTEDMHKGDTVALGFVIENTYSQPVDVSITFADRNDNFTINPVWSSQVIDAEGGTVTLTLNITLVSVPTESISGSIFSVTITAAGRNPSAQSQ